MKNLINVIIDGKAIKVKEGTTVMQASDDLGIHIPRLCYHKRLSVSGKCRMCLVEVEGIEKPVSSCTCLVEEGMNVKTNSAMAIKSRKDILEFLLANHPLDCPTCKKANECDLQEIVIENQLQESTFPENKRGIENFDLNEYIKVIPSRCTHCMRCVKFCDEIAGKSELGEFYKGEHKVISAGTGCKVTSNLSGNLLDLCPVGALISKPFIDSGIYPWEVETFETFDLSDSILPSIYADTKDNKVVRIRAREHEEINQEWISNETRFSYQGLYKNRIETPQIKSQDASWEQALDFMLSNVKNTDLTKVAAFVGDKLSVDDMKSFTDFMNNTFKTNDIGFISKNVPLENFIFEGSIDDIDETDLVISVGTDFDSKSPVLNSRIFQAQKRNNFKFYHIGGELENYSYNVINLGKDIRDAILNSAEQITSDLENSNRCLIFVDVEVVQSMENTTALLSVIRDVKETYNAKLNFFIQNSGVINAASIKSSGGFTDYNAIIEKLENGNVDILFVYGEQDIPSVVARKAKFLVYVGSYHNDISKIADIVLPSVTAFEKSGHWTNVEGKVLKSKAITLPFKGSKPDWKIWKALAEYLDNIL
ncbi:MAG: molybdopterin-dependent oxidoreductase [Proteobacteria bacterium]|nr:molybdopterin-dependent oxidoreductase [Pseudomonadota bacterium]